MVKKTKAKKKKGISALIATVLLIVVAVVLVAIILAWSKQDITGKLGDAGQTVDMSCKDAALYISSCKIVDENLTMVLTNNSLNGFNFSGSDTFKVDVLNESTGDLNTIDLSTVLAWTDDFNSGDVRSIDVNLEENASNVYTATKLKTTIKSTLCSSAQNTLSCTK